MALPRHYERSSLEVTSGGKCGMRLAVLAVALLPAVLTAQSGPAPRTLEVPYRQFQLANGLNVIMHRDTSVPIVAVNVWYHVGSANERPGRTGFAHLFEHLM